MNDEPVATAYPKGLQDEFPDGPPTTVVKHRGCRLVLRFAPGDFMGEGLVQELRLLPDTQKLEPRVSHVEPILPSGTASFDALVDDKPAPIEPNRKFAIDPGTHYIVIRANGRKSQPIAMSIPKSMGCKWNAA